MSEILTSEKVNEIFMECLFQDGEEVSDPVIAEGVLHIIGFHRGRLESHKETIVAMLKELPEDFQAKTGGGSSFLNACMTKDGEQWGEHLRIEQLLTLGIASGQAKYCLPREMWSAMPGGMPYFVVL